MNAFPKELQIQNIEGVLTAIYRKPGDLLIPIEAKTSYFGGLAAAIQCVNTWARESSQYKLICQSDDKPFKDQQLEIIQQPYKFSVALMAQYIEFRLGEEKLDIRNALYSEAKIYVEEQSKNQYGFHRGNVCSFSFVDHSTKGFDRNFYTLKDDAKPIPRKDSQIGNVIRSMIEKTFVTVGGASPLPEDGYKALERIFVELFKNTHEHGSKDINKEAWLRPAVRTLYTKTLNMNNVGAQNMTAGANVLATYINSLSNNNHERKRYMELGIIDSGLGFYKRWQADHPEQDIPDLPSIEQEYEIFKKCFTFRRTSSHEGYKGMGLPEVMEKLTALKGFMKVRSGRLSLYRDFNIQPYVLGGDSELYDWNTLLPGAVESTIMAETAGVSITLLIPLGDKK
ncbi:MAG: hypothetical protein ACJAXJ_001769 [Colwellia sp.]|jgi:hypothetical protein